MDIQEIIKQMSLPDKIRLCSGADAWHTKAFPGYGIPAIALNDGPHGLRKPPDNRDNLWLNESSPATCFPTASTVANAWDRELVERMGQALGEEAREQGVDIVLGPGVNIKRSPLCGRNFEYYSEDPFLSGELGTSFVQGLQSQGVGASLKHFAANSQENGRMLSDSLVDERALREIYLLPFEKVVQQANPTTVMCAYNQLNGTYCSDNPWLLTKILREEWGFDGAVVSDWGATNDRVAGIQAGMDLEMPGNRDYFAPILEATVEAGRLSAAEIDVCVERLLRLISLFPKRLPVQYDRQQHHQLAREIAGKSAVLLKNDGLLPLDPKKKVAVVGRMAKSPRYQGAGSSHINPENLCSAIDAMQQAGIGYQYFEGYPEVGEHPGLIAEAVEGVQPCDAVIIFAGLPDIYESEAFDRENMQMPTAHNRLIEAVCQAHPKVVVVLSAGSPVEMPWANRVQAILHMYLAGQAGGLAAVDLLFGKTNPSGKLAESYPYHYSDVVNSDFYGKDGKVNCYRESLFVGYRYYDKAGVDVLFPFGYGLSYTRFEYSGLQVEQHAGYHFTVTAKIRNVGGVDGEEVVQLYVSDQTGVVYNPEKELKGFEKVSLQAGEEKTVTFHLDERSFAFYHVRSHTWSVVGGSYSLLVGASSRDIRLQADVFLEGNVDPQPLQAGDCIPWYRTLRGKVSEADFAQLYGRPIPRAKAVSRGSFTLQNTANDLKDTWIGKLFIKFAEREHARTYGGLNYNNPAFKMVMETTINIPLIKVAWMSEGRLSAGVARCIVEIANGRIFHGVLSLLRRNG